MSTPKRKATRRHKRSSKARLDQMVEEAIVDCYNESEQATGLHTMIENNLALPFETTVLGVPVTVERIDLTRRDEIVAVCRRARLRQTVPIIDLPLPPPRLAGAEMDRRLPSLATRQIVLPRALNCSLVASPRSRHCPVSEL
jgi:hypothetical protein